MPSIPTDLLNGASDKPYRVLLTGFGPFGSYEVNPAWLAVKPLHNVILDAAPVTHEKQVVLDGAASTSKQIHITSVNVPTEYGWVLSNVPSFHARPPVLPAPPFPSEPPLPYIAPPEEGYDLVFHVGVTSPGVVRMETQGHKYGYRLRDAADNLPPIVAEIGEASPQPSEAEKIERDRLPGSTDVNGKKRPIRGFGEGYEDLEEEIQTEIDVAALVAYLKEAPPGDKYIGQSFDAGHYLCDFIYYCSLANNQRQRLSGTGGKRTKVLFFHCPPIDKPLSTEEVTEIIKKTIVWVAQH
ncbi:peptidase C15, pyroglutamyl peptidase I-like protein [Neolentinus lepideus HHB14362 ss-1]|uniref:Peptidase C15, pyroglutamyl peptidase I-like protein n=1 Tax=Neolentinus lepideus HHB14362 ss-1 TaxID=1314782 RepID=A0A165UZI4_9AGAM|nr:peptidase C15, pyroglutamyl peptidase I-like protein [Neolentinus lepideus HHB14362 ss-1]